MANAVGSGVTPWGSTVIRGLPGTGTGVVTSYNPKLDINKDHGDKQELWSKVISGSWDIQWDRYAKQNSDPVDNSVLMVLLGGLAVVSLLFGR